MSRKWYIAREDEGSILYLRCTVLGVWCMGREKAKAYRTKQDATVNACSFEKLEVIASGWWVTK